MRFVLAAGLLWRIVSAWVASDAVRRGRPWFRWAVLVWFTNVIGLAVWLAVRRRSSVSEDVAFPRRAATAAAAGVWLLCTSVALGSSSGALAFQLARNQGQAMQPTLADRDRFVVNWRAYRFGSVQPGDVITFSYPLDQKKTLVKRVIAKGGDTVQIVDGRVIVNGTPSHDVFVSPPLRSFEHFGPHTVPPGHYFVLGDHRRNSSDSRHWGPVPERNIRGRVLAKFGGSTGWALIHHGT